MEPNYWLFLIWFTLMINLVALWTINTTLKTISIQMDTMRIMYSQIRRGERDV